MNARSASLRLGPIRAVEFALFCTLFLVVVVGPAQAADVPGWQAGDFVIKGGPAVVFLDSSAKIELAGTAVPDGSVRMSDSLTATSEFQYFPRGAVSVALTVGIPPTTRVQGTGSLSPFGELGRVRYGLGALSARYHVNAARRFSPYAGLGVGRLIVFDTKDGAVSDLDVDDAWTPVIQAGVDFHINGPIGLYANVAHAPLSTRARGSVLGLPMTARVPVNLTSVQIGLGYRF